MTTVSNFVRLIAIAVIAAGVTSNLLLAPTLEAGTIVAGYQALTPASAASLLVWTIGWAIAAALIGYGAWVVVDSIEQRGGSVLATRFRAAAAGSAILALVAALFLFPSAAASFAFADIDGVSGPNPMSDVLVFSAAALAFVAAVALLLSWGAMIAVKHPERDRSARIIS